MLPYMKAAYAVRFGSPVSKLGKYLRVRMDLETLVYWV